MEYYEISVPDKNDAIMRANLDGTYYYLRTTWNESGGFWLLSIYDAEMTLLLGMARLCPGTIWNFFYLNHIGPPGIIGVKTDNEEISRSDFVDGNAHLVYMPESQFDSES